MEVSDKILWINCDLASSYLREIFNQDFFDCGELWSSKSEVNDLDLVQHVKKNGKILSYS